MTEELKRCPFCGETRPHFVPGGYCVKILKAKLDEARSELENERDTRKNELGNGTLIAINNAQAAEIAELKRIRGTMAETITQQEAELQQAREALRSIAQSDPVVIDGKQWRMERKDAIDRAASALLDLLKEA